MAAAPADQQEREPRLPRDGDGYTASFDAADELDAAAAFFERHGVVVLRDALAPDEVDATVREVFAHPQLNAKTGARTKSQTDPADWEDDRWPTAGFLHRRGFVSPFADFEGRRAWANRQNPRVYGAFARLLGREDLLVKLDRYGLMRPTLMPDNTRRDDWLTQNNWLHWDQNPWKNPGYEGVQGLLALSDSREQDGGFVCVPGLHADGRFEAWAREHEHLRRGGGVIKVPEDDPLYAEAERVFVRPGSLVVWDSRLLHANVPNRGSRFRVVQYVTYLPSDAMPREKVDDRLLLFADEDSLPPPTNVRRKGRAVAMTIQAGGGQRLRGAPAGAAGGADAAAGSRLPPLKLPSYLSPLGRRLLGAEPWPAARE